MGSTTTTNQILPSVSSHAHTVVKELFAFITAQGNGDYIGESVSQLEHSLQAAHLAQQAHADEETVLGALLHDVGRFIPAADKMPLMMAADGTCVGHASHEVLGEQYLRQLGFSEKICQLVGAHVMAKRYLTAVDPGYYDSLSKASKTTLKYQGGIFGDEQVREAQKDPWLENKLAVRRWDDQAKVPNMQTFPLSHYEDMAVRSLLASWSSFELHGRVYQLPRRPTVAVCVDGFDPEYLQQGIVDGILPTMKSFVESGFHATAKCAMPSFTIPNNVSIITGVPTSVHGMAGNFFLDKETGKEAMILDDALLRGSTILEQMSNRGVRVAAITAKDKLRKIIRHGLKSANGAICFSSERPQDCTFAQHGISDVEKWLGHAAPHQYSGDLSVFVLDVGVKLLEEKRADLLYLTLSDYIQHKFPPGAKESNDFLAALDTRLGRLVQLGAIVAVTGDHGMSAKTKADGTPNVVYLEEELERMYGAGIARVICPITDPFVRHHGALGSFARVHSRKKLDDLNAMLDFCRSLPQLELVLSGEEAAKRFDMPLDREGDFVAVAKKNAVIGSRSSEHDLSNVGDHQLRSHGGLSEQDVPLLRSLPVHETELLSPKEWRNFDIFDLALNW